MKAADPAPVAHVKLGAEKDGYRRYLVQLGSWVSSGRYEVATGTTVEKSWKHV